MKKTILLTGATDGIGFVTAKKLVESGHHLLIHGRNPERLEHTKNALLDLNPSATVATFLADLSDLKQVETFADSVIEKVEHLDVLINNAGVFKTPAAITPNGLDVRFVVNLLAPFVLTHRLLPVMDKQSRVINLSSAAQAPVSFQALEGSEQLSDSAAYAQSKLAITMWTLHIAAQIKADGPSFIAVNPASFLGSKMVKEAYGSEGKDLSIGANILVDAATSKQFEGITGKYFDNDIRSWSYPHPDAMDAQKNQQLNKFIVELLERQGITLAR